MNLSVLAKLSPEESAFQLWYLASSTALDDDPSAEPFRKAREVFGDLRNVTREERLAKGKRKLADILAEISKQSS